MTATSTDYACQKRRRRNPAQAGQALTPTQRLVIVALIETRTYRDAARLLEISPLTLGAHMKAIRTKTGTRNVADVVLWGVAQGVGKNPFEAKT